MIKIQNICLKYTKEFYALYDVSINVSKDEKVALVGEDNSGKTTLLRILARLEKFDSGEIYIKDIPLKKIDFKNDIEMGYLPACPVFIENKTVAHNLRYILKNRDLTKYEIEQKINEALIEYDIVKLKDEKIKNLTLYNKYLISIIRLSFRELDLILIDNIFDKVDENEREKLIELIEKFFINKTCTVLLATTKQEIAKRLCGRFYKFKLGSIEK